MLKNTKHIINIYAVHPIMNKMHIVYSRRTVHAVQLRLTKCFSTKKNKHATFTCSVLVYACSLINNKSVRNNSSITLTNR